MTIYKYIINIYFVLILYFLTFSSVDFLFDQFSNNRENYKLLIIKDRYQDKIKNALYQIALANLTHILLIYFVKKLN